MERCKVVSHMYVSIDGKIDGDYMNEKGCNSSGEYYDSAIWSLGDSMASGRVTNTMYHAKADINLNRYKNNDVCKGDYILKADHYHFCFDRMGKSMWESNIFTYGGIAMQNVAVLSSNVKQEYLSFLRDIKVSYIIVDTIEEALEKIKMNYGVHTLVLTGGATINGAFHEVGCIDEISLVMAPYIEGNHAEKGYAEMTQFVNYKYKYHSIKPLKDGGIHLLFAKVEEKK
ncbi:MAG: dihydrofolate reductase family protein [Anaeroplasmataceae bacterium]|nr:dihydrofolate reductase family protein [Anaeroplasmataceae bacterium]